MFSRAAISTAAAGLPLATAATSARAKPVRSFPGGCASTHARASSGATVTHFRKIPRTMPPSSSSSFLEDASAAAGSKAAQRSPRIDPTR